MKKEFYIYWEECVKKIHKNQIIEAEEYGLRIAKKLNVSTELVNKILSINLKSFEKIIDEKMNECIERAREEDGEALCLYYDLDNGWESTMYICKNYTDKNSHWISKSRSWVDIGKVRGFSGIYKKEAGSAFFIDNISSGICILVMLRTTLAFYNTVKKYNNLGLKFCITCTESDFVRVV